MSNFKAFVEEPTGSVANYPLFDRGKDSCLVYLYRLFQERIVMFDGAMGTMIQKYKLGEEAYRGERFKVRCVARQPLFEGKRFFKWKHLLRTEFLSFMSTRDSEFRGDCPPPHPPNCAHLVCVRRQ